MTQQRRSSLPEAPDGQDSGLKRILGLPALVFFGLAYMVPLTVFTTYGVVTETTGGHVPMAYVITLAAMFFTAYSYGKMVEHYPTAGSAYTYTRRAFGGRVGFMVGWALLLDYIFLPMINYLVIGIYMKEVFPAIDQGVWVVGAIVAVTALNILGIKLVAKMNLIIIGFQFVFLATFIAISLKVIAGGEAPSLLAPFHSEGLQWTTIVGGAAILCLSFLGFDAVSTLCEETREPKRDIPRAIMLCTLIGGGLFILASWVGHLVFPDYHNFGSADSAAVDVMRRAGGGFLVAFFTAAYVAGCFASAMAAQASVSRILFAMGRDQVLPKVFGKLSQRYGTPLGSTLIVGAISLMALVISLELAATMISFGALVAFSFVNLSVIKHYLVDEHLMQSKNLLRYGVMPSVGFLLTIWLWSSLSLNTFQVGLTWVAVGFAYLLYLTRLFKVEVPDLELKEN
ncbi:APC family permease [Halomonas sp. YLB-10]|uniref:APC family permease n=1 Tax=Halomonas sp. YLB-10 TaxID=2483111 RepID=UPI000F5D79F6|nr:APC family permease [Halomonas sp. YLB-10]RQW72647.1 APC family permease [Halomonas sp. YLB-10]